MLTVPTVPLYSVVLSAVSWAWSFLTLSLSIDQSGQSAGGRSKVEPPHPDLTGRDHSASETVLTSRAQYSGWHWVERSTATTTSTSTTSLTSTATMSVRARPALVGRRFLSVTGRVRTNLPKLKHFYDWDWRAGWIRSSTSDDPADPELQVCEVMWCEDLTSTTSTLQHTGTQHNTNTPRQSPGSSRKMFPLTHVSQHSEQRKNISIKFTGLRFIITNKHTNILIKYFAYLFALRMRGR